jgi:hypothetical protein
MLYDPIMLKLGVALLSILAVPALAQSIVPPSTVKDALVKHWKTSGDFSLGLSASVRSMLDSLHLSKVVEGDLAWP